MSGICGLQQSSEEASLRGLAGLELQHDLYLTLPDAASWGAVSDQLGSVGGELISLQLSRLAEGFSARARVKEISSEQARALTALLLEDGLAQRASVEHLMLTAQPRARGR